MNALLSTVVGTVKHWYIPLIIGVLLIILGIDVLSTPVGSYLTLTIIFSLSFLVTGLMQIIFSISNRQELSSWGWHLVGGILYVLFGLLLVSRPEISVVTLPFIVGFFVLFHSINALGWAYQLKRLGVRSWGNTAIAAVLGIIFSFILLWNPVFAGLSLVIWTGLAFIFTGIAAIVLSVQLKKLKDITGEVADHVKTRYQNIKKES
jgi:uncharacterized membrane protein HdeD (DUF308 family)